MACLASAAPQAVMTTTVVVDVTTVVADVTTVTAVTPMSTATPVPFDISQIPEVSEPNVIIKFELGHDFFSNFRTGLFTQAYFGRMAWSAVIINSTTGDLAGTECECFDEDGVTFGARNTFDGGSQAGLSNRDHSGNVTIGSFVCRPKA
jgi:hypothetical protein